MLGPSTRRSVLQAIATVTLGSVTGCSSQSDRTHPSETGTETTANDATQNETPEQIDLKNEPLQANGDWPTYNRDNLNSSYARKASGVPNSGTPYWRIENGYTPVVSGETLYLRTNDGVVALDAQTGSSKWNANIIATGPSPAIADGNLFITSVESVASLDAATGSVSWSKELNRGPASAPTVSGESLYFCHGEYNDGPVKLHSFDKSSGEQEWVTEMEGRSPSDIVVTQDSVFVTTTKVRSFSKKTGQEQWTISIEGSIDTVPVLRDRHLYLADLAGIVYAIDTENESIRWRTETGTPTDNGGLAVTERTVYYNSEDGIYALDSQTGEQRWKFRTSSAAAPPTVANDTVYFGTTVDGRYLRAVTAEAGDLRWKYQFPQVKKGDLITGGVFEAPVVVNDALFVRSAGGYLYAFGVE